MTDRALTLPPAMSAEAVPGAPYEVAQSKAILGCDAGLVVHHITASALDAALVLAPEVPLRKAAAMLPLCGVGFQNALGALAPPEVAVHLTWQGGIKVNGAACGQLRLAASTTEPDAQPDWLVIGLHVPLLPESEETGLTPDQTALMVEGCADIDPGLLLEAWARHTLNWIARWEAEGSKPLHAEWRGLVQEQGEDITLLDQSGTFLGTDEDFGLLLRQGSDTRLIPLTDLLEDTP